MTDSKRQTASDKHLTIGWLYPELMSTYGDCGNITVLQKRCEWRGIKTNILNIDQNTRDEDIKNVDLLFGGGAQDREQTIVISDLKKKQRVIKELIENNIPSLFVCGSPQLFGKYYEPSDGVRIQGLGIFDITSVHPGPTKERLIGNIVAKLLLPGMKDNLIVGFENHGGRTYLGQDVKSLAQVIKGYGNNGTDGTEGLIYKNALGSYLHGPLLPKNPEIADWLIKKALEIKYKENIELEPLDNTLEIKAKSAIAKRLGIEL